MKTWVILAALTAFFSVFGFVASHSVMAASYGKGGGSNGTEGTISGVGSSGFTMTTMGKDKDSGKTYKVKCDINTKFMSGKDQVGPSEIKVGIKVGVQGGMLSADEIVANTVTILGEGHKSK